MAEKIKKYLDRVDKIKEDSDLWRKLNNDVGKKIEDIRNELDCNRLWIHLEINQFCVSIETQDDSSLLGRPVAIGNQSVLTMNEEAKKDGVEVGMLKKEAKECCSDLAFLIPDFKRYRLESHKIKEILEQFDPDVQMVGLDEAYLDITLSDPEMISQEIKEAIKPYTATIGIAVNKLLAKICSS